MTTGQRDVRMGHQDYGSVDSDREHLLNGSADGKSDGTMKLLVEPSPVSMDNSSWESVANDDTTKQRLLRPGGLTKTPSQSEMIQLNSPKGNGEGKSFLSGNNDNGLLSCYRYYCERKNRRRFGCLCISIIVVVPLLILFIASMNDNNDERPTNGTGISPVVVVPRDAVLPDSRHGRVPFSTLDPVTDLGLYDYVRPMSSSPPSTLRNGTLGQNNQAGNIRNFPTNSWYQNFLLLSDNSETGIPDEPGSQHRAYSIPYIVDVVGPIPGLRVHPNQPGASVNVVQLNIVELYGLTIGIAMQHLMKETMNETMNNETIIADESTVPESTTPKLSRHYSINQATPLSVTLEWDEFPMQSTISKGMPYATMVYETITGTLNSDESIFLLPTIAADVSFALNPIVDRTNELTCSTEWTDPVEVHSELELFFEQSDFSWLVFVSEPVLVQCIPDDVTGGVQLQVVNWLNDPDIERNFVMRIALNKLCTSGRDPIYCHQEKMHPTALFLGQGNYDDQLRKHAHLFPGPNATFDYEYNTTDDTNKDHSAGNIRAILKFDWNVQNTRDIALHPVENNETVTELSTELLTYALPHHFDMITEVPPTDQNIYCVNTLIGPACLYEGSNWNLVQDIPQISFSAPRPPAPWSLPSLGDSLKFDLDFTLPKFYLKGIGDTYFSGKMLAKLGRILLIAEEVQTVCTSTATKAVSPEYVDACKATSIPRKETMTKAISRLKSSVEIWINGSAVVPLVFDSAWGGVVSCGCVFDSNTGKCKNKFPDCSGFGDPGLNFGNAWYNDMHFHYGYHIYAAAVVSHFDPAWGRKMWEQVLLLVRCIANPSDDDPYFPTWRHKDWYQGHSWASGIAMVFPNGKNQESSSEAIAAYEAVALYGKAMSSAWESYSVDKSAIAEEIGKVGEILTASEVRAAQFYWHVKTDTRIKIYPTVYTQHAIGILWQMMAQFQTWFGNRPFLACGIQLLPLTPIAEFRDSITWSKQMYVDFANSCEADETCESNGWSVLQLALLATVGHPQDAAKKALALNTSVFDSAGGNGHSLTNTLWYLSTRRNVDEPLSLTKEEEQEESEQGSKRKSPRSKTEVFDCGQPDKCSDYVLDTIAGLYTCRQRMNWLMQERLYTEKQACYRISVEENPLECGRCDPEVDPNEVVAPTKCTACSADQCNSDLNRCPTYPKTFVCTKGTSVGGCAPVPWDVPSAQCSSCCELTTCPMRSAAEVRAKMETDCPPCTGDICSGSMNQCPNKGGSQYLCLAGRSTGGCSMLPWAVGNGQCEKCCAIQPGC